MQTVLSQLNAVPGVIGTLVCSAEGKLLAHAFPPAFDGPSLADAARLAAESATGLATITGPVQTLELRHANARIVVRPIAGASLLVLCSPKVNTQPLAISISVAAPRLERLVAGQDGAAPAPVATAAKAAAAAGDARPPNQLYAAVQRINAVIERRKLDTFKIRGEIAVKAGFGLGFIDAKTEDDPERLSTLKAAATAVLGEPI